VGSDSPILARFEETGTGAYAAITLHWNGVSWSMITTPSPSGADQLSAVSGTSSGDVWAVGASLGGGGFVRPFIIHWDGSQWQTVGNPTLTGNYALEDVVAFAPNNVWAVGYSELTEHWDGIQWNIVWIQSGVPTFLAAITASSPTDKWAVGDNYSPSRFTTATRHWTGSVWSIVPSPNTGSGNNFLYDVDAFSSTDVWATGVYTDVAGFHGLIMRYNYGCGTGTPTPPITPSPLPPTSTPFSTSTPTLTPLVTFTPTQVVTPTMTETPCPMSFSDVHSGDYFYYPVLYLACHNVMSGYSDGTFRPYANTTRGQLTKIIVLAEGWKIDTSGGPHFSDVPSSDPFYDWVETAYHHNIISGYSDGTFRQYNDVTRSQLCKIVVLAEGWPIDTYGGPHFSDVPATYYGFEYIETAYHHGIITGYADGTFRPGNNATRGQISKIVYLAIMGQ
jgi:hypothetical protein